MKKALVVLAVVFAMAFAIGVSTPSNVGAARCYLTCSCEGTPLECCVSNGVTTCKFTKKIECLQIITC